ncbi:MAG: hypothetical protein KDD44_13620, partial [Bdellovibrionales bacterium]|nr:hypothetical protein [Bdellovibrionales bacterium]
MAKRLWEKGDAVDAAVHEFTVGNDPQLDRQLVRWDSVGSAAHARMLAHIGILSGEEIRGVLAGLKASYTLGRRDTFQIPSEFADVHPASKSSPVEKLGETG